jgi:hypothetical protein
MLKVALITIRPKPNEYMTIVGNLKCNGKYAVYIQDEKTCTDLVDACLNFCYDFNYIYQSIS